MALAAGLVPLVYGDVIFDRKRGGIILSTEELFDYLARVMKPEEILLAGMEEGVWKDFPVCSTLIQQITPAFFPGGETLAGRFGCGGCDRRNVEQGAVRSGPGAGFARRQGVDFFGGYNW